MELREIIEALHDELEAAGLSPNEASAKLAFSTRKERNGTVRCEFVDAASMSKPRPEEIHILEITLSANSRPEKPAQSEPDEKSGPRELQIPPALPPKRSAGR